MKGISLKVLLSVCILLMGISGWSFALLNDVQKRLPEQWILETPTSVAVKKCGFEIPVKTNIQEEEMVLCIRTCSRI